MRKILIPTDFSKIAFNALEYAVELFKYEISEFFIMHAYKDEIFEDKNLKSLDDIKEISKIISDRSNSELKKILRKVSKISPNPRHTYKTCSSNNILLDEMDKIVEAENIDIVVMGTRGETNDRKLTFGSHTLQVLKYVRCPVMVIPENYKHTQPRLILFPTNYLIPYKRRELKLLCEMAHPYRAKIDVVHISKVKNKKLSLRQLDNQAFLNEGLCRNTLNFKSIYSKNIIEAIYEYIRENEVEMLVMVNNKHSFSENIIFQSTIDEFGLHLNIPFLVLQNITR